MVRNPTATEAALCLFSSKHLHAAFDRVVQLAPDDQDRIGRWIIEHLDNDPLWRKPPRPEREGKWYVVPQEDAKSSRAREDLQFEQLVEGWKENRVRRG